MTAQNLCVGAPPHPLSTWKDIDWTKCNKEVRRLQARIVKATREGRHGKVKALQWILTHSFSGKALAVKRVTENQGRRTPGVDKTKWTTPEKKYKAIKSLKQHGYNPLPLRRTYIPKPNGKTRPLGIPTMKDRAMQALYLLALEPIAETGGDKNSFGFRQSRSTADAIGQCFTILAKKNHAKWILEADIKGCFDNISHDWLLENTPTDKKILEKWLKAGYMYSGTLYKTDSGTPQGGIISAILANLTLDGIEPLLLEKFKKKGRNNQKVNFVRYADDFIITGASRETLEKEVRPVIEEFLAERGLTLSQEKTKITHIEEGFNFLGYNIRKYNDKLLIKPAKENIQAVMRKIRGIIKSNKMSDQGALIKKLNPVIQGWANYYKNCVAKEIFANTDHKIWQCLWQWAKRRHQNKGLRWIKEKYFLSENGRNWIFAVDIDEAPKGKKPTRTTLKKMSDTKIKRHTKIKAEANPFDPEWESYFEQRDADKMLNSLQGRKRLIRLWINQKQQCPICHERITATTGWNAHFLTKRAEGGKSNANNLIMVHPDCHKKLHSSNTQVWKPVYESRH
jgi:RNA-directed DNA polymerase